MNKDLKEKIKEFLKREVVSGEDYEGKVNFSNGESYPSKGEYREYIANRIISLFEAEQEKVWKDRSCPKTMSGNHIWNFDDEQNIYCKVCHMVDDLNSKGEAK